MEGAASGIAGPAAQVSAVPSLRVGLGAWHLLPSPVLHPTLRSKEPEHRAVCWLGRVTGVLSWVCPGTMCLALTLAALAEVERWQREGLCDDRAAEALTSEDGGGVAGEPPLNHPYSVGLSEWRQVSLEKLGPVAQACYPSSWEAEAGASQSSSDQPGLHA